MDQRHTVKKAIMFRTKSIVRKLAARRANRDFDHALRTASPSMKQELRAMAMRIQ
jgi:hypothetical protein